MPGRHSSPSDPADRTIRRIGLLSPCGWGNLGDAAIQDATITAIRRRHPEASIVGFTLNPADTARRHGIGAYPLSGYSQRTYPIETGDAPARLADRVDAVLARLQRLRFCYRLGGALRAVAAFTLREPQHAWGALKRVRALDLLLVSGGGQLDEYWGGPLGHPYVLWKWSLLARLAGTPIQMLSVGVGELHSALSRRFVRAALRRAAYCSLRDARSRELLSAWRLPDAFPVVPDLAFGILPANGDRHRITETARVTNLTVGVSPIAYGDPVVWPMPAPAAYARYVGVLAAFVSWLLEAGHAVTLFATDGPDHQTVRQIRGQVSAPDTNLRTLDDDSLERLLETLDRLDLVVASRLHGVVLAHLSHCPVLALSYDWKVDRHMSEMGQDAYSLPIDEITLRSLTARFSALAAHADQVRSAVEPMLTRYRDEVEQQFDRVLRA